MDSFNAVRIRACRREDRKITCQWESKPLALHRSTFESYETAANRVLAGSHFSLGTKFRRSHTRNRPPKALIAHSEIHAHAAWMEVVLVNVPRADCLSGQPTLVDLQVAA